MVTVPNLRNLTQAQAKAVMENSGLYLQTKGSYKYYSVVTDQEPAAGSEVPRGTTVTVELTDQTALD
jgi:beta-lactam-binding protein with PASTA domain